MNESFHRLFYPRSVAVVGASGTRGGGDGETRGKNDTETQRQGDAVTRRHGEAGKE